uniref:FAD dependent oxidoreductase domain-containing protein n=1 Tax=Macaca nemestrina TaxID=9545 RepID=A0A2K6C254_MACNE
MAFQKAVKATILVGRSLSQLAYHRRKQMSLVYVEAADCISEPVNREPPSRDAQLLTLRSNRKWLCTRCHHQRIKNSLVERDDFSSGTSSRSTKLIHGGVRYVQKAMMKLDIEQYRMVTEALDERANLPEIAPLLSAPLSIMLPVYKWWQLPYYWVGIKLYDFVAGSNCLKSTLEYCPMLQKDKLVGGILTADRYGGATVNDREVVSLLKKTDTKTGKLHVSGAWCKDVLKGQECDMRAKCVINAMGHFTDTVCKMDDKDAAAICQPSAGVHIVMPGYYSPEIIFFLPWQKMMTAGTTDTPTGITHHPLPSEDINFI